MIRTYTIKRPAFLDGGRIVEEGLTIHQPDQWHPNHRVYHYGDNRPTRIYTDVSIASKILADWTMAGRDIRYATRSGL